MRAAALLLLLPHLRTVHPNAVTCAQQGTAGVLPPGSLASVPYNSTTRATATFSYLYTPTTAGSSFVALAFRHDPGYWYLYDLSVTPVGGGANLLVNGNMASGGSTVVGSVTVKAPASFGVFYQSGTLPPSKGIWSPGQWTDGSQNSIDGIYHALLHFSHISCTHTLHCSHPVRLAHSLPPFLRAVVCE